MNNFGIEFIPVNDENIEEVAKLHVSEQQKDMIETVEECFEEAKELSLWRPVVISKDGEMIGFAMYGLWKYEEGGGRVWMDRFLIDERHQGKGYANTVLPILINHITQEYNCEKIYLSVYENNAAAIHLYEKFGFLRNGETDLKGEKVMVRTAIPMQS